MVLDSYRKALMTEAGRRALGIALISLDRSCGMVDFGNGQLHFCHDLSLSYNHPSDPDLVFRLLGLGIRFLLGFGLFFSFLSFDVSLWFMLDTPFVH